MHEARIELLQGTPVFGGVREEILSFILGLCPVVLVEADDFFFRENDKADSMFVLEAGRAAVLKSWQGEDCLVGHLAKGDCFGEMALMDLLPRSASVRALEDCAALEFSAANLYKVYEKDVEQFAIIEMNMGREVSRRLREASEQLVRAKMGTPDVGVD